MRDEHRRESFDVAASLPRVGTGIACRRAELVGTDAERDALWQCPCSLHVLDDARVGHVRMQRADLETPRVLDDALHSWKREIAGEDV